MKKIKAFLLHYTKSYNVLACIALAFAIVGANSPCCCIYHQPDKPNLRELRKF